MDITGQIFRFVCLALAVVVLPLSFFRVYRQTVRSPKPHPWVRAFLAYTVFGNLGGICLAIGLSPSPLAVTCMAVVVFVLFPALLFAIGWWLVVQGLDRARGGKRDIR